MAERLVTYAELRDSLDELLQRVAAGETVVLVDDPAGDAPRRRAVLLSAAAHAQLTGGRADKTVEATVGGVAGGLVAGAGTALSTVTGRPGVASGARKLGRRLGRALAVGIDALDEPRPPKARP